MYKLDLLGYFITMAGSWKYYVLPQTTWYTTPGGGVPGKCGRSHWFRLRAFRWTAEWIGSAASAVSLLWRWQNGRRQAWRPHRPGPAPAWGAPTRRAHSGLHTAAGGAGWSPGAVSAAELQDACVEGLGGLTGSFLKLLVVTWLLHEVQKFLVRRASARG